MYEVNTKCYLASFEALVFIYCCEGFAFTTGFRLYHSSDVLSPVAYNARNPQFCRTSVRVGFVVDKVDVERFITQMSVFYQQNNSTDAP